MSWAPISTYDAIHGPRRPGGSPMFATNNVKGITDSERSVIYPGDYHYFTRANMCATETGTPLTVLKTCQASGSNDSKLLAAMLAVECTRIALPPVPLLPVEDLM